MGDQSAQHTVFSGVVIITVCVLQYIHVNIAAYARVLDRLATHANAVLSTTITLGRPMSCVPGYFEIINPYNVGSLTIPRASIKWV